MIPPDIGELWKGKYYDKCTELNELETRYAEVVEVLQWYKRLEVNGLDCGEKARQALADLTSLTDKKEQTK